MSPDMDFAMLGLDTLPDFATLGLDTLQQQCMQFNDSDMLPADESQCVETIPSDHEDGGLQDAGGLAANAAAGMATPTHIPVSCACCGHQSRDDAEANNFVHVGPLATHK